MLNEYLEKNYNKLKDMAFTITSGGKDKDDLLSFVIEELYKCNQDRINDIIKKKQLTFYIARVMINQFQSDLSLYYKKYKKYYKYHTAGTKESISPDTIEKTILEKQEIENKLEWVDSKLKDC